MFEFFSSPFWRTLLTAHLFTILGVLLVVLLLRKILRDGRTPTSTLAWLLSMIFVPYLAIPFYILFAGRQFERRARGKSQLHLRSGLTREQLKEVQQDEYIQTDAAQELFRFATQENVSRLQSISGLDLFSSPEEIYRAYIEQITAAEQEICIATYILGQDQVSDALVEVLCERAREGVQVFVLLDALGSFWSSSRYRPQFEEAGVILETFMPVLPFRRKWSAHLRNHRKLAIFDRRYAIVGGANFTSEYMSRGEGSDGCWRELSFGYQGEAVDSLFEIFKADFEFAHDGLLEWSSPPEKRHTETEKSVAKCLTIASGPDVEENLFADALVLAMSQASERIWVVTPYFVPDEVVLRALIIMKRAGKDVRLITPERSNHPLVDFARTSFLKQLTKAGIPVYLYQGGMLHSKAILVDSDLSLVGSANLDRRSLYLNFEITLALFSRELARSLESTLEEYISCSRCFELDQEEGGVGFRSVFQDIARLCAPLL